jgi:beta-1,2-mannobiose phosphorylase / 1,2-beta-oligomannan phosphorylase
MDIGALLIFLAIIGGLLITTVFLWGLVRIITSKVARRKFADFVRTLYERPPPPRLIREDVNPILRPTHYPWESAAVLNPGIAYAGGKVHLFYRAIGSDGISRVGYAASADGIHFTDRLSYPVFALDGYSPNSSIGRTYMEMMYPHLVASGGSWGGVEDPRAVIIGDRLYLSFSAFYNWHSIRVGVVSISINDLLEKRWRWSRPVFLSPPGQVNKNWVLFPEKINGRFAVLHSLHSGSRSRVLVDYLDSLDTENAEYIQSSYHPVVDESVWDNRVRSAGPPPIKTEKGWLLLYHANDVYEPHKYKIGALLLDLHDPSRVLARSSGPVLEPDVFYENDGKPGIIYACGADIRADALRVYYGGADAVVCVAATSLSALLKNLS